MAQVPPSLFRIFHLKGRRRRIFFFWLLCKGTQQSRGEKLKERRNERVRKSMLQKWSPATLVSGLHRSVCGSTESHYLFMWVPNACISCLCSFWACPSFPHDSTSLFFFFVCCPEALLFSCSVPFTTVCLTPSSLPPILRAVEGVRKCKSCNTAKSLFSEILRSFLSHLSVSVSFFSSPLLAASFLPLKASLAPRCFQSLTSDSE